MGKRIVILLGSPRKRGNSAKLAEHVSKGARSKGAKVETFYLNGMSIKPCLSGCCTCRPNVGCAAHGGGRGPHHKRLMADTSAEQDSRSRAEPAFQPASTALGWTCVWRHRWPVAFMRSELMRTESCATSG
jgi:hypothetical protein